MAGDNRRHDDENSQIVTGSKTKYIRSLNCVCSLLKGLFLNVMYKGDIHNFVTSTGKYSQYAGLQWGAIQKLWDTPLQHKHSARKFQITMTPGRECVLASVDYVEICTLLSYYRRGDRYIDSPHDWLVIFGTVEWSVTMGRCILYSDAATEHKPDVIRWRTVDF